MILASFPSTADFGIRGTTGSFGVPAETDDKKLELETLDSFALERWEVGFPLNDHAPSWIFCTDNSPLYGVFRHRSTASETISRCSIPSTTEWFNG